ncbi:hypothetical protein [Paludibacterium denitrificans]|uniref:Lysis protein n=1 Tax=Paludibacterium denitrificans TaxID=2675226 RepID=A0A844GCT7_9NEIS|nr:hypothetical protein [Paludibacterium denitrificans]MTD32405.1 hypothetical protein [Paludibacterium denitrificans]
MPTEAKLIALLVSVGLCAGGVLWFGHSRFEAGLASGRAELTGYKLQVETQRGIDAEAAHRRYQDKADELAMASNKLDQVQQYLDTAREQLNRRITHAALPPQPVAGQPSPGLLSVDGLQFYNDALGLGLQAGPGTDGTDQSHRGRNRRLSAADSGVSREDLLAHVRDYGTWCRKTAAQRDELIDLLQGKPHG